MDIVHQLTKYKILIKSMPYSIGISLLEGEIVNRRHEIMQTDKSIKKQPCNKNWRQKNTFGGTGADLKWFIERRWQ